MYKSCSKCGKIHKQGFICDRGRIYKDTNERKLRNTFAWANKSREIREKAQFLCEVCRTNGAYVYTNLEVHHITKLKDNPKGLLDDYNLICLCSECHKQADNGEIDANYLRELAKRREEE